MNYELPMRAALAEAEAAAREGEIPIGAVVVDPRGRVIARAHNRVEALHDPTAHAEMLAITAATEALGAKYLEGCTLYVTVEPCPMCAGAIGWSHLPTIVYGADDPKRGYTTLYSRSPFHPKATVVRGVLADECADIMTSFFKNLRH